MKPTLWTRNFTLIILATAMGSIGGIAGTFALSFLVFDETGSTLASTLVVSIQLIPYFIIPLVFSPLMDRLPRKPFLVGGDIINGVLYLLAGIYLMKFDFSYTGYLGFSLLISSLSAFDQMAYNSIYPRLIPKGMGDKGYSVSSMLYPIMRMTVMPLSAVLFETIGVAWMLVLQGCMSLLAAAIESRISIVESSSMGSSRFSFKMWWSDICEAAQYIKQEKGLRTIYSYLAVANGLQEGYAPLLVAFFRTFPGYTAAMYSFVNAVQFGGRLIGAICRYSIPIPPKRRFKFTFWIYQIYQTMDITVLWLPYPLMLVNRCAYGFLGVNSATMRRAAVQRYIPDHLRTRVNAFESILLTATGSVLSLTIGAMGEIMDYRMCMTFFGAAVMVLSWLVMWRNRSHVSAVYEYEKE